MKRNILLVICISALLCACVDSSKSYNNVSEQSKSEIEKQKVRDNIAGYVTIDGGSGHFCVLNKSNYTIDEVVVEYYSYENAKSNYVAKKTVSLKLIPANNKSQYINADIGGGDGRAFFYAMGEYPKPQIVKIKSNALGLY